MIIAIVITAAILSIVLIKITLGTLSQLSIDDTSVRGEAVRYYTEGCLQEALIRLNRDNSYVGGSLNLGEGNCQISVSGSGTNRTVVADGDLDGYYYKLTVVVSLSPFHVITWDN